MFGNVEWKVFMQQFYVSNDQFPGLLFVIFFFVKVCSEISRLLLCRIILELKFNLDITTNDKQ